MNDESHANNKPGQLLDELESIQSLLDDPDAMPDLEQQPVGIPILDDMIDHHPPAKLIDIDAIFDHRAPESIAPSPEQAAPSSKKNQRHQQLEQLIALELALHEQRLREELITLSPEQIGERLAQLQKD